MKRTKKKCQMLLAGLLTMTDIGALSGLKKLKSVEFKCVGVKDLSELTDLEALEELRFVRGQVGVLRLCQK